MGFEALLFYFFGALALVSACAMVAFVRNVVAGVMSLVVTMVSLAAIFVLLEGYLVAALQVMVYAGAIVVLFLFVIMLLNLRSDDFGPPRSGQIEVKVLGVFAALGLMLAVTHWLPGALPAPTETPEGFGGYRALGLLLFTDYVVPVETAGLLLLAAIVGAVTLAKKRLD